MSVQICEGVWRNRTGQRVFVTQCEPVDGQRWTDGNIHYSDNGSFYSRYSGESENDLVEHLGPFPGSSQRAPVTRPAETESTTAVAGGVGDDPGRIIYDLEQRLEAAKERNSKALGHLRERDQTVNELRTELEQSQAVRRNLAAEVERLGAQLREAFSTAQQLRSENESLAVRLQRAEIVAAEALQKWETTEQVCLKIITAFTGVRS